MWDYLDKMNHNLLYKYAAVLSGKRRHFYNTDLEKDASVNAEEKCLLSDMVRIPLHIAMQNAGRNYTISE